jgi:hypothetical protein
MKSQDEHIDRMLGYLGLFIVGALGWTSDRLGELRTAVQSLAHDREGQDLMVEVHC